MSEHPVSILFTDTKDGKPGVVVNGQFLGHARRIQFGCLLLADSAMVLERLEIDPLATITGIPRSRLIPPSMKDRIKLTGPEEDA